MQWLARYLEHARQFEFLAGEAKDDLRLKRTLLRQVVVAYRMLAVKRADKFICQDRRSLHSEWRAAKIELSHLVISSRTATNRSASPFARPCLHAPTRRSNK
jgi:hypothetical protein